MKSTIKATPAAPWVGGKRYLAKRLAGMIDARDHATYVEPFVGMAGVFLARAQQPKGEVLNDINGDVTNFFRVLQRHEQALLDELRWCLTARPTFRRQINTAPDTLTDIERAARFFYLQRLRYGGKPDSNTFAVTVRAPGRYNGRRLLPILTRLHERLAGIVIEQMPYPELIERYDRSDTLFYCDPPYWGCEDYYGPDIFSRDDFTRLAALLARIKGRWILSINDVPEIRTLFAGATIKEVETSYSLAQRGRVKELIINN